MLPTSLGFNLIQINKRLSFTYINSQNGLFYKNVNGNSFFNVNGKNMLVLRHLSITNTCLSNDKHNTDMDSLVIKKPLKERIRDELIHYKNGTKLFFLDLKLSSRYIRQLLNGKNLSVREKLQLKRTIVDIFRLVPFLALVLIPFAEFALPFIVKIFPGFLPSTFHGHRTEMDTIKQKLLMDLEYRSTMYAEIGKYHYTRKSTLSQGFAKLMDEVRAGRRKIHHRDLLKYSKYMSEDDLTDILTSEELQSLLRTVWIKKDSKLDPEYMDELTLSKLDEIEQSDQHLKELVDINFKGVNRNVLVTNCEIRGLLHSFFSDDLLKQKLARWIHYRINYGVPVLFMLLTRLAESEDSSFITNVIKAIPDRIVKELEINIAADEGEKLNHQTMYDIIKKEEELIQQEQHEMCPSESTVSTTTNDDLNNKPNP